MIPYKDYQKENEIFSKKITNNIEEVIKLKSEYKHEKYIENFEKEFAEYNHSKYAIAVNSGTTALQIALKASGIKKDDEVILPAYTYISTALAVSNVGAKPGFIDIKKDTLTIDPEKIRVNVSNKTKAIIPVHIHGNPCDMEGILEVAKKYNLKIIEDASHAHGAEYSNKKVGNFGIGCFSCHTTKNLAGIGNSGLITTNDKRLYEIIKKMVEVKNNPDLNLSKRTPCKINAIQASILKAKLPYLDKIITRKRNNACSYIKNLPKYIEYQKEEKDSKHVYRDFVIITEKREKLANYLEQNGVETKIRYKTPLHLTGYYKYLGCKRGDFQVTEEICKKTLCLPISYSLSKKDIEYICSKIITNEL